jgi:3-hydroxymyristoyl/3-hydroxydecanoyl-(acyl carrier protein) dehydratase
MIDPGKIFAFTGFEKTGLETHADWRIPQECPYLDGHFPGFPIFPAVGLLDGSLEFLKRAGHAGVPGRLTLKKAKFTGLVTPGLNVRLSLVHKGTRVEVEWRSRETGEPLATFSY